MAWITASKVYSYVKYCISKNPKKYEIIFVWDLKFKEGRIIINIYDKFKNLQIEPNNYIVANYISCAKRFLKIVKDIEKIASCEDTEEYLKNLE